MICNVDNCTVLDVHMYLLEVCVGADSEGKKLPFEMFFEKPLKKNLRYAVKKGSFLN